MAVTSYTDNEYEAPFFALDKKRQEIQYYNIGFLYELQSQLETWNDEVLRGKEVNPVHLAVIRENLPVITDFCGMEPYQGNYDYQSLNNYMEEAAQLLSKRGNEATFKKDALVSKFVRENGKQAFLDLKRAHYNIKLEEFVTGADQRRLLDVIDESIVPRAAIIYLTPHNKMGRAPFYSSEKILGQWHVKTLWFNMGVLLLMSIICIILLLFDCPGRYMRKE